MERKKKPAELGHLKVRKPKRKSLREGTRYWTDRQDKISYIKRVDGNTRIYHTEDDFCIVDDCMRDILPWLDDISFCKPNSSIIIHFQSVTKYEPIDKELEVWLGNEMTFIVKERRIKEFIDKYNMYKYLSHLQAKLQNKKIQN
jgi:hypothetical protein